MPCFQQFALWSPRQRTPTTGPQRKSGLSPTGVLRQSWHYDTTVFITKYTPHTRKTQTTAAQPERPKNLNQQLIRQTMRLISIGSAGELTPPAIKVSEVILPELRRSP